MALQIPEGVASAVHELEQRERRFRAVFESALDAILIFDDHGRILEANFAAAALLGASAEALIGRRFEEFCASLSEGREIWNDFRSAGRLRREFEIGGDGDRRLVESSITADVVLGQHVGVIRDVTEQRGHEREKLKLAERFERLFRTDLVGMAMVNRKTGCVDDCNRKLAEFFGRAPEDLIGRHVTMLQDFFTNRDRYQRMLIAWASGAPLKALAIQSALPDGSTRYGLATFESLPDADGQGAVDVAVVVDITEQHRLEAELRDAQRLEAIGRLAGAIAHDFNNLLAVISGFATLLGASLHADAEARDSVEEIKHAAARAVKLVHGLLAFSRQEVFDVRTVDLHRVIGRSVGALNDLFGPQVHVELCLRATHPWVKTDALQIEHVLLQLAGNSREAMPNGGKFLLSTDDVGPDVKLSVQDSGIGMEPATLERAFEPFFSTKADGTGLGLSTVYGIITQSGGRVGIESEPSKGTTVAIVLPAVEAPATEDRPAAPPEQAKSVAGTETVLLTADDTSVALLIESFMSRLGYRVLQTVSIDDAARVAGSYGKPIDLAIIGLRDDEAAMPFVDALRSAHPELPALLLTSFSPDPQTGIAEDSRTTVLARPFALAELAAAARQLLDN